MMKEIVKPVLSPAAPSNGQRESREIQRFLGAERLIHWALAVPFVLLYVSASLLLATWWEPPPRPFHHLIALIHRAVGVCLVTLPPLAMLLGIRQWRTHLENMGEGWIWNANDFRWLVLFPKAAVDSRITLPEQGKFNAAEKLNFMMVSTTYPLYVATGIWIWMPGVAFIAWIAHLTMALVGLPLVLGHIFMATVNPGTRIGLQGMVTGWVDREWAKHHYRRWYRSHFEKAGPVAPIARVTALPSRSALHVAAQLPRPAVQVAAQLPRPAVQVAAQLPRPAVQVAAQVPRPAVQVAAQLPRPAAHAAAPPQPPVLGLDALPQSFAMSLDALSESPVVSVDVLLKRPAMVRCTACDAVSAFGTWEQLMRRVFQVEPLFCPSCDAEILVVTAEADVVVVNAILEHLESDRGHEPFREQSAISA